MAFHLFSSAAPTSARARLSSDLATIDGWRVMLGVLPIDLNNESSVLPEMIEDQTMKVFENIDTLLKSSGLGREHIVAIRISLADFDRIYERMNVTYSSYFPGDHVPLRTCVGVTKLRRGALIEMDVYAYHRS